MSYLNRYLLVLLFVICSPFLPCLPASLDKDDFKYHSKLDTFEYLTLAQFWPAASCIYFHNKGKPCQIPPGTSGFTIHGLWPSSQHGKNPEHCNSSLPFKYDEIKTLSSRLEKEWPYFSKGGKDWLWQHEWENHGTCAYPLPALQGELRYFSRTLDLHANLSLPMEKVLASSGIVPSNYHRYKLKDIFQAVKKGYGKIPIIACLREYKERRTYLDQVWLCYDKTLAPIDCPEAQSKLGAEGRGVHSSYVMKMQTEMSTLGGYFHECHHSREVFFKPY